MLRRSPFAPFVAGLSAALLCSTTPTGARPVIAMPQAAAAQPDQADRHGPIEVDDARPLAAALSVFEKRHGVRVTYEDPRYLFPGDVVDVTSQVRRDGKTAPRVIVPLGGSFRFAYERAEPRSPAEAAGASSVLGKMLEEYGGTGYPGVFRLAQSGEVFHVIPSMDRNASGNTEASVPLLDATISLAIQEASGLEMMQAIVDAITAATGTKVAMGVVPLNPFIQKRMRVSATTGTARTVLLEALQTTSMRLSWRLFCSPEPRFCALNIHGVERVSESA